MSQVALCGEFPERAGFRFVLFAAQTLRIRGYELKRPGARLELGTPGLAHPRTGGFRMSVVGRKHRASGQGQQTVPCPECGHSLCEHADSGWGPHTVCTQKLDTFPDGGWYGVCPCVLRESA